MTDAGPPTRRTRAAVLLQLRTLLLALVTAVLITSSLLLGGLLTRAWERYLQSDLEAKGVSLARTLASHAEYGVLVGDREGLSRLIDGLRHDPDLIWATVRDSDGTLLAEGPAGQTTPAWLEGGTGAGGARGGVWERSLGGVLPGERITVARLATPAGAVVRIEAPVTTVQAARSREDAALAAPAARAGGTLERVGAIVLVLSLGRVEAALADAGRVMVWVTLLAVAVGILLAAPLAHLVMRPVQRLVLASRRIAEGELEVQVPESFSRELSELGHAFNQMAASLRERDQRLSENAAELERRSEALRGRTQELEAANDALVQLNSELRLSQEQLRASNTELLHISGRKSAFVANMSHELRTPLNSIIGYTECLIDGLDGPINPDQAESLERVLRNGRHLLQLINEILDLSRIEAGRMELSISSIDLEALAGECVASIQPLLRGRPLTLRTEIEPPLPCIEADASRVRQVLINLLSNAVKFTDQGEVVVSMREAGDGVEIEVADTGRGIPADKLEEIFLEFRRLEAPSTPGTGLGLAITRRLVELMSGRLMVESQVGEGSRFRVWLPATAPATSVVGREG